MSVCVFLAAPACLPMRVLHHFLFCLLPSGTADSEWLRCNKQSVSVPKVTHHLSSARRERAGADKQESCSTERARTQSKRPVDSLYRNCVPGAPGAEETPWTRPGEADTTPAEKPAKIKIKLILIGNSIQTHKKENDKTNKTSLSTD